MVRTGTCHDDLGNIQNGAKGCGFTVASFIRGACCKNTYTCTYTQLQNTGMHTIDRDVHLDEYKAPPPHSQSGSHMQADTDMQGQHASLSLPEPGQDTVTDTWRH